MIVPSKYRARGSRPYVYDISQVSDMILDDLRSIPGVVISTKHGKAYATYDIAPKVAELTGHEFVEPTEAEQLEVFKGIPAMKRKGTWQSLWKSQRTAIRKVGWGDYGGFFDDMRGGKSRAFLGTAEARCAEKVLIVCPARVRGPWARECFKYLKARALILRGRAGDECRFYGSRRWIRGEEQVKAALDAASHIIVNYDILSPQSVRAGGRSAIDTKLPGWGPMLRHVKIDCLGLDEVHEMGQGGKYQDEGSQLKLLEHLFGTPKKCPLVYALTGTFIADSPVRAQGILNLLGGSRDGKGFKLYDDKVFKWQTRYCGAGHVLVEAISREVWTIGEPTNTEELAERIRRVSIRRSRAELAPDMPDMIREKFPVESDPKKKVVMPSKADINRGIDGQTGNTYIVKQLLSQKLPTIKAEVGSALSAGRKVLITTYHVESAKTVYKYFLQEFAKPKSGVDMSATYVDLITSEVQHDRRDKLCQAYVEHPGAACIVATAGSVAGGLSLRGCSEVHVAEFSHKPDVQFQAETRGAERGQGNILVRYYYIDSDYDRRRVELILPKLEAMERLVGDKDAAKLRRELAIETKLSMFELMRQAAQGIASTGWYDMSEIGDEQ